MQHSPTLNFFVRDSLGKLPDMNLVGQQFRHRGNGQIYTLTGYAWDGESDRWFFVMTKAIEGSYGVPVVRPLEHLEGNRENGSQRYARELPR